MPVGLIAAGVGAAATVAGSVISGNSAKSAANTSAAAARDAQGEQARQFDAAQSAIREGTANANVVQAQQHDATLGAIDTGYADAKAANKPYLTAGTSALTRLAQIYGLDSTDAVGSTVPGQPGANLDPNATFYQSPDYQFRLDQGIKGLDAAAGARGMRDSGATRKAAIQYAGNLASGEFGNYAARLANLAGIGQTAVANNAAGASNYVNAIAGANQTYSTQYGNAQLGQGTNLATAGTNFGNNYAASVQNAANNQANAQLAQGANTSNAINGFAGQASNFLNNNYAGKNLFSSSYSTPVGQSSGLSMGWT